MNTFENIVLKSETELRKTYTLDELIGMPVVDFRDKFSFPHDILRFGKPRDVFWTTTDGDLQEVVSKLKNIETGGIMLGVSGGVDAALTHAAIIHPSLVTLFDVNVHAINNLHYRLELTQYFDHPVEYLQSVFPVRINWKWLTRIKTPQELSHLFEQKTLFGKVPRLKFNRKSLEKSADLVKDAGLLGTDTPIDEAIALSMNNKHHWIKGGKIDPDWVLYSFFRNALWNPDYWLYLKDDKNYSRVRNAYREGRIKFARIPLQLLDRSPIYDTLINTSCPRVRCLYLSNVNEYLSDNDFGRLIHALRALPEAEDMKIIYSAAPPKVARLGRSSVEGIENAPRIRDFPWMDDRLPDIELSPTYCE